MGTDRRGNIEEVHVYVYRGVGGVCVEGGGGLTSHDSRGESHPHRRQYKGVVRVRVNQSTHTYKR